MTELVQQPGQRSSADIAEYDRRISNVRALMRTHGLDIIIANDEDRIVGLPPNSAKRQPPYARYLSNFYIPSQLHPHSTTVIVPLSGDPVLIIPPGIKRSFVHLARSRSWIAKVVDSYVDDPTWEVRTRWGWFGSELASVIADELRTLGAEHARIGLATANISVEDIGSRLPSAHFEKTLVDDGSGTPTDLLAPLLATNSEWEIGTLEVAHSGADAMTYAFIETARSGGSVREARAEAQAAGIRAGVEEMILFGSIGADPFTYWDWSLAVDESFRRGKLYFFQVAVACVNGYEVQSARSFVVGGHGAEQLSLMESVESSLSAIYGAIRPGITGEELYSVGLKPIEAAGFELWGQLGHSMGFKLHAGPRGVALVPGNLHALTKHEAMVVHVCALDKDNGNAAMVGDTILIEDDGFRFLSAKPLGYEI